MNWSCWFLRTIFQMDVRLNCTRIIFVWFFVQFMWNNCRLLLGDSITVESSGSEWRGKSMHYFFYCRSIRFSLPINQLGQRANFRDYHFAHCKISLPSTTALVPVLNDAHRLMPTHLCFPIKISDEIQFYVGDEEGNFEYTFTEKNNSFECTWMSPPAIHQFGFSIRP